MIDITTGEIIEGSYRKYIGLDVHARQLTCAVAERGQDEPIILGQIANSRKALKKLVAKLGDPSQLCFCYEAGCCGFEIYRYLTSLGVACVIAAPSRIPRQPGDRIKNDRRDSLKLARLLRAGELTSVWVPDEEQQAMRDLTRARSEAKDSEKRIRQKISSFLLQHGLRWQGKSTWGKSHLAWLGELSFVHRASRIVLDEYLDALEYARMRVKRLGEQIEHFLPQWKLYPLVASLMAMRGIDLITASQLVSELGDLRRFPHPAELMSYLGLIPSEHFSDGKGSRGKITKAGNGFVRKALVESANAYRHPPKKSAVIRKRNEGLPMAVQQIAWKAQLRLCSRYRYMMSKGKHYNVVKTAVAREMCGFIWAIGQIVQVEANRKAA